MQSRLRQRSASLTALSCYYTRQHMSKKIWLRVQLPEKELSALRNEFPDCQFTSKVDDAIGVEDLQRIEAVFTEEALPDSLVGRMPNLKWLHVTRGGVNTYLTPTVKFG